MPDSQDLRDCRGDSGGIGDGSQSNKINAAWELGDHFRRRLQSKSGFPASARTREGNQPWAPAYQKLFQGSQLLLAPNQRRAQCRQTWKPCARSLDGHSINLVSVCLKALQMQCRAMFLQRSRAEGDTVVPLGQFDNDRICLAFSIVIILQFRS